LSVSFTAVLVLKHSCSGYSTIVPEHSWMQDVLAQLGLAGYNQELDLSCIPCLSYSNKQPRTVIPKNAQFRHSDKAPGRNLNAIASRLSTTNG